MGDGRGWDELRILSVVLVPNFPQSHSTFQQSIYLYVAKKTISTTRPPIIVKNIDFDWSISFSTVLEVSSMLNFLLHNIMYINHDQQWCLLIGPGDVELPLLQSQLPELRRGNRWRIDKQSFRNDDVICVKRNEAHAYRGIHSWKMKGAALQHVLRVRSWWGTDRQIFKGDLWMYMLRMV